MVHQTRLWPCISKMVPMGTCEEGVHDPENNGDEEQETSGPGGYEAWHGLSEEETTNR